MKGELHASLNLDMDHEYWTQGRFHAATKGLHVAGSGVAVDANLKLDTELRFNPKLKINMLQKFVLRTRDMTMQRRAAAT